MLFVDVVICYLHWPLFIKINIFYINDLKCKALNDLVPLQRCARGYRRVNVAGHPFFGECIPCNCHGHTEDCDPDTGKCLVS